MQFVDSGWGYDRIEDGPQFRSREEAAQEALRTFSNWFPFADPKYGVLPLPGEGSGSWFLQARRLTADGEIVTEVDFKDFRPVRRMTNATKVEMFPS
jgi:hypothetical protein